MHPLLMNRGGCSGSSRQSGGGRVGGSYVLRRGNLQGGAGGRNKEDGKSSERVYKLTGKESDADLITEARADAAECHYSSLCGD